MSRSGYSDDYDGNELAMYRGVIASATRGKRGQRFFVDLAGALDAMPVKRLIANDLVCDGEVCALGALGQKRGVAGMEDIDTYDSDELGKMFDIAHQLAAETMYFNDEAGPYGGETPEQRWQRVRSWAAQQIRQPKETR